MEKHIKVRIIRKKRNINNIFTIQRNQIIKLVDSCSANMDIYSRYTNCLRLDLCVSYLQQSESNEHDNLPKKMMIRFDCNDCARTFNTAHVSSSLSSKTLYSNIYFFSNIFLIYRIFNSFFFSTNFNSRRFDLFDFIYIPTH